MQPQVFQPRSDSVKGAVNGIVHPSILPFGNNVCTPVFSIRTMRTTEERTRVHDLSAR
jgi:hypothetical protein